MIFMRSRSFPLIVKVSRYCRVATATRPMGTFLSSYQGDILMEFRQDWFEELRVKGVSDNHEANVTRSTALSTCLCLAAMVIAAPAAPVEKTAFTVESDSLRLVIG